MPKKNIDKDKIEDYLLEAKSDFANGEFGRAYKAYLAASSIIPKKANKDFGINYLTFIKLCISIQMIRCKLALNAIPLEEAINELKPLARQLSGLIDHDNDNVSELLQACSELINSDKKLKLESFYDYAAALSTAVNSDKKEICAFFQVTSFDMKVDQIQKTIHVLQKMSADDEKATLLLASLHEQLGDTYVDQYHNPKAGLNSHDEKIDLLDKAFHAYEIAQRFLREAKQTQHDLHFALLYVYELLCECDTANTGNYHDEMAEYLNQQREEILLSISKLDTQDNPQEQRERLDYYEELLGLRKSALQTLPTSSSSSYSTTSMLMQALPVTTEPKVSGEVIKAKTVELPLKKRKFLHNEVPVPQSTHSVQAVSPSKSIRNSSG